MDETKESTQTEESQKKFRSYSLEPDLARKSNKIRARPTSFVNASGRYALELYAKILADGKA